jgi:hypothetical protein
LDGASYGLGDPEIVARYGSTVCYYLSGARSASLALSAAVSSTLYRVAPINLHPHEVVSSKRRVVDYDGVWALIRVFMYL